MKKKTPIDSFLKMLAKLRRLQNLNAPFSRGGKHKNKKKDIRRNNTIRNWED